MKRQIRSFVAVLAASALAVSLSSCSTAESTPDSLELWLPTSFASASADAEKKVWEEILTGFEEKNDVDVNLTLIPWSSYEEKYLTGVSSGEGPDVGYMYTEMMGDYVQNGALATFDGLLSQETIDSQFYLSQGQVDGKQYAVPFVVGGMRMLWGNTDLLKQGGVAEMPTTWDEFMAASEKLKAAGITPILEEWGAPDRGMLNSTFFPLLWQAGGDILTEDGSKTAFNSEAGLEAANFVKELLDKGYMPKNVSGLTSDEVRASFYDGKTAFFFGSDATRTDLNDTDVNAEFVPSLKGKQEGTFVASDALVLLESCSNKQLCADLVSYLVSGDQMATFHKGIVPYPPIGSDENAEKNEFSDAYTEKADALHSLPIAAGGAAVYNSLYQNLQQMVLGQKTPEQALADAAEAGDAALAQAQ